MSNPTVSLLSQLKTNRIAALKSRDSSLTTFLTTLYSEAANTGLNDGKRESTDAEVTATLKKFIKNAEEILKHSKTPIATEQAEYEIIICESYLPKQMTEEEIKDIVYAMTNRPSDTVASVMAHFKEHYAGRYDGKLVSTFTKERVAQWTELKKA
jgi:uncharacterized protein